jgi:hypothetical protein
VENLRKIITIKSLVTFKNYYPLPVRIWQEVDGRFVELSALAKGAEWVAPLSAVYSPSAAFYLSLQGAGQNMGLEPISWKDIEPAGHCRKVPYTIVWSGSMSIDVFSRVEDPHLIRIRIQHFRLNTDPDPE